MTISIPGRLSNLICKLTLIAHVLYAHHLIPNTVDARTVRMLHNNHATWQCNALALRQNYERSTTIFLDSSRHMYIALQSLAREFNILLLNLYKIL